MDGPRATQDGPRAALEQPKTHVKLARVPAAGGTFGAITRRVVAHAGLWHTFPRGSAILGAWMSTQRSSDLYPPSLQKEVEPARFPAAAGHLGLSGGPPDPRAGCLGRPGRPRQDFRSWGRGCRTNGRQTDPSRPNPAPQKDCKGTRFTCLRLKTAGRIWSSTHPIALPRRSVTALPQV